MADSKINIMTTGTAFTAFVPNTTNTSWVWGGTYVHSYGRLRIFTFGITVATTDNDYIELGAMANANFFPPYTFKAVCQEQDSTESRMIEINDNGKVRIYKPTLNKCYWGQIVYLV